MSCMLHRDISLHKLRHIVTALAHSRLIRTLFVLTSFTNDAIAHNLSYLFIEKTLHNILVIDLTHICGQHGMRTIQRKVSVSFSSIYSISSFNNRHAADLYQENLEASWKVSLSSGKEKEQRAPLQTLGNTPCINAKPRPHTVPTSLNLRNMAKN